MLDINRFKNDIKRLENIAPTKGNIVFYGSSTFTFWKEEDIKTALNRDNILNLAFGGSTAKEALHFADRVLFKHSKTSYSFYTSRPTSWSMDNSRKSASSNNVGS